MNWTIGVEGLAGAFPDGSAVTLGVFDGVHRGHRALLQATVEWASAHGVPAVALSFHPHPAAVLAPDRTPPMLCTLAHRVERLHALGADYVIIQPFTREFAQLSAEAFIEQVLMNGLNARAVIVGDDFRFGRGRTGDVDTLRRRGAFEVITIGGVLDESGERISSTRIREMVQAGNLEQANALLGEPLHWVGVATRGDGRGRAFGYPTANLVPLEPLITPLEGVYACVAVVSPHPPAPLSHGVGEGGTTPPLPRRGRGDGGEGADSLPSRRGRGGQGGEGISYPAAVSVGKPPMFENARGRIEAYLIDFPDQDLYGRIITLQFLQRLRPQQKFESVDALLKQMAQDVQEARRITQEVQSRR